MLGSQYSGKLLAIQNAVNRAKWNVGGVGLNDGYGAVLPRY